MDLLTVSFSLQFSMLLIFSEVQESKAGQLPTRRHSSALNHKGAREYLERRRKHGRHRGSISLKPPPQDWPELALSAGDFLEEDRPETTAVSPLHAYQTKLEQELIRQQKEEARSARHDIPEGSSESLEWTPSEEDFKKLLDPGELIKHNKQLKPFMNQGKTKTRNKNVKSADQQGNKGFNTETKSSTSLKASTGSHKTKRKSKVTTTDGPPRRGRRRKNTQKELLDDLTPLKELKKRKVKMKESGIEGAKPKKRRRKVRKFAFAGEYSKEYETESTTANKRTKTLSKTKHSEEICVTTLESVTPSTQMTTKITSKGLKTTEKITLQGTRSIGTSTSTEQHEIHKYSKPELEPTTTTRVSFSKPPEQPVSTTKTAQPFPSIITTSRTNRDEIREKRKQVKQEMEKVIEAEQLDSSFSDRDSQWTTSEKQRFPLSEVTPRHALASILKHKIMSFVDSVLKENTKETDSQRYSDEEKISKESHYTTKEKDEKNR